METTREGAVMNAERNIKLNPAIEGRTLLMHAAFDGDLETAARLLQKGADVNACDADGDTALMFASFNGHYAIVKLLLGHGADVFKRARNGWTAKLASLSKNHRDVVALLEWAEEKTAAEGATRLDVEYRDKEKA